VDDRWHSPGLETRGNPTSLRRNGPLSRYIWTELDRNMRKAMSIELFHGNAWSGWRENGNPYGDPRPGPIAVPRGVQAPLREILRWITPV